MEPKRNVLIVGQGLAGTCLAIQLMEAAVPFRIINKTDPRTASRVAAGVWNPVVLKRFVPVWMAEQALDLVKSFYPFWERQTQSEFFYHRPLHKLISNEEELQQCRVRFGSEALSRFCREDLNEPLEPGVKSWSGNLCVEEAGYLDVPRFLDAMQHKFKASGTYTEAEFDYASLSADNGYWVYQEETYTEVVFAEGAGAVKNPWLKELKFRNTKGEILRVHLPKLHAREAWNKQIFVMPVGRQEFRVGATYSWKKLDAEPSQEALNELQEKLEMIVNTEDMKVLEHVAGVRPTMPDRRPVLGELPGFPGAFVFNGLGSRGVMLAPLMAKHLVASILSNTLDIPEEARLQRFKAFKGQ